MEPRYNIKWLIDNFEQGENFETLFFWGHSKKLNDAAGKYCLSQWAESAFIVNNITYKTSEHWMMAQKALLFEDNISFMKILESENAWEAKKIGRYILGFDEIEWVKRRFEIVKIGNIHKFNQNSIFLDYLLQTGNRILVEASPIDQIWGIGLSQDDPEIENIYAWCGQNLLGFALMEVRDFFNHFGHLIPLDNVMIAPWLMFPKIERSDLFWRMGKGEDYITEFFLFYNNLSIRDKTIYKLTNPAPYYWCNFYEQND